MNKMYRLCLLLVSMLLLSPFSFAQHKGKGHALGKTKDVFLQLKEQADLSTKRMSNTFLTLQVSSGASLKAKVNYKKSSDQSEYIVGAIDQAENSDFVIKATAISIEGNIVLRKSKKAYRYFSNETGEAFIEEVDINEVVCIEYEHATQTPSTGSAAPAALAMPDLQSLPGANGCVLLDFDGQYVSGTPWNGGNPINAAPSGMSDAAIQDAFDVVAEDFRPFNINITTNEAVFNSYPKTRRMRCIVTPTNTAAPGAGGVAYVNSFTWNDDTPCWVFILTGKNCGEASSHEVGHTLGLSHDGRTSPQEGYYQGHGNWAPIMGVGYYRSITQWSKGEYANANNKEDDLAIITRTANGVGYRADDHGNTFATARPMVITPTGGVNAANNNGIIERTIDIDMFSFTTSGGTISLTFNPSSRFPDLDILVTLYNSSGSPVSTYNPTGLNAPMSATLTAGTYYLSVDGTGYGDPLSTGYSDYGSLGYYSISGTIPSASSNLPPSVAITYPSNGASFVAPDTIRVTASASDPDGTVARVEFFNGTVKIGEDATAPYTVNLNYPAPGTYNLSARATDNSGASTNSSVVTIQVTPGVNQAPSVALTSPAPGSTFTVPATITLSASASDADGTVSLVEFFDNGVKVGEDATAPYSLVVSNVPAGSHSYTARATDNAGAQTLSASVSVSVNANQPPVVSITSPSNGASFTAPASITINASASDPDGTIARVEFFNGSVKLGEDLSAPYSFTWTGVGGGTYTLTARATDNAGAQAETSVSITVTAAPVTYCSSRGNNTSYEYIQYVNLGSISNTTGSNGGYGNFTSQSTTVAKGSTYRINFRPGFTGSSYTEYWTVRIDLNIDGDFTDAGETVVTTNTSGTSTYYANFTIPATAATGTTRMRVSMKYGSTPGACETYTYGEVEDYSVVISTSAAALSAPDNDGAILAQSADPAAAASAAELSIHPNPAQQSIVVDKLNGGTFLSGKIVDVNGITVKTIEASGPRLQVEIDELKAGMYLLMMRSERGEVVGRFIKQ